MRSIREVIASWIARLWSSTSQPAPVGHNKPQSSKRAKPADDVFGEFHFRDSILDQLDRYFVYIRRMKRGDPEAYDLYKRLGAHILPRRRLDHPAPDLELPGWWLKERPSFGAIAFAIDKKTEATETKNTYLPKFVYFRKYAVDGAPTEIERAGGGDVYVMTWYWDKMNVEGYKGAPTECAFHVDAAGNVRLLRMLEQSDAKPKSRGKGRRHGGRPDPIPVKRWQVPSFFVGWAKQHDLRAEDYMVGLFIETINAFEQASAAMTRIVARKDNMAAAFAVAIERTPYFFRDREKDGKKIFHIVRAHKRRLAGGAERYVRTHFRGQQTFTWNGYKVEITVPGWHHFHLMSMDVGVYDEDRAPQGQKAIYAKGVGKFLTRHMTNGVGGERERRASR